MTDRRRIVAGNWKMHGSLASARKLARALAGATHEPGRGLPEVIVFPPFPHMGAVRGILEDAESTGTLAVQLGAQDVSRYEQGAHTGEVSADMLLDCGCGYVLVGHSERRTGLRESDELVAKKFRQAADRGLIPVLCVGETLAEREAERTAEVVLRQLGAVMELCGAGGFERSVLAYEPVWAIGTGHTATPEQAQQVHALLRGEIARTDAKIASGLRILYGGSVNGANAAPLFAQPDIDGGLVGGASLDAKEFLRIITAE